MDLVKDALKKMNETQLCYCRTASRIIKKNTKNGLKEFREKEAGKLRGYLECMENMGIISNIELKALYMYFFTGEGSESD